MFRRVGSEGPYFLIGRTSQRAYLDEPIVNSVPFSYVVRSRKANGKVSAFSSPIEAEGVPVEARRGELYEICDGQDNDADGAIDEGLLNVVTGALLGACIPERRSCIGGSYQITEIGVAPSNELCDGSDNDCDDALDEGFNLGAACSTGEPGICSAGVLACNGTDGKGTRCAAIQEPQVETCGDGIDQDCQGFDLQCPTITLTVTDPLDGAVIGASPIAIRGTVSDVNARVAVGNSLATKDGASYEVAGVSLVEGANEILVRALNDIGAGDEVTLTVTLDGSRPQLAITSPPDRWLTSNATVTVAGFVSDDSEVACTIAGAAATTANGTLSGDANLSTGPNLVEIVCTDAAGNASTVTRTLFLDTEPLFVTAVDPADGASDVPTSADVSVTFSEPLNPASVGPTTLSLHSGSAAIPATAGLGGDGQTVTLSPTSELPGAASVELNVSTGITGVDGNRLAAPFWSRFSTGGTAGELALALGEVYDDTRSLPLEAATITAFDPQSGLEVASVPSDERGRYLLAPAEPGAKLRIEKAGFTSADRVVGEGENGFVEVLDARLTPLEGAVPVAALIGASLTDRAGNTLEIPPGALPADADVRLTAVSQQGPQGPFPLGWTPLGIAEIEGFTGADPPAELGLLDLSTEAGGFDAFFARYDAESGAWVAISAATVASSGATVLGGLSEGGQIALVVPDGDDGGPAPPAPGEVLAAGAAVEIPESVIGSGTVVPEVGRADDPTPAEARVDVVAGLPLRSGTPLRGDFMELFLLRDGGELAPLNTSQDLFGYRSPVDAEGQTLFSVFPVAPSRTFGLSELETGTVTVALHPGVQLARALVGSEGGGVEAEGGDRVLVPAGALPSAVPVELRRLAASSLLDASAAGFLSMGGLDLDLSGATADAPLVLTLAGAASLVPTGSEVVVAEARRLGGRDRLVLVALGRIEGDDVTTVTDVGGATLPGVRRGGRYGFYRFEGALDLVPGTAREEETGLAEGHLIEVDGVPFVSVSGEVGSTPDGGLFALVSPPGDFQLLATGASAGDALQVAGNTASTLAPLVIPPTAPRVELLTVRLARVEGNFAGPVVLVGNPAPRVDDDATGPSSGDADGEIEPGETIELFLSVRNDGTVAVTDRLLTLAVVDEEGTPLSVSPESIDLGALDADAVEEFGPFVFAAPGGSDPNSYRYTLRHLSQGGLAGRFDFGVPMSVDYIDVPVASEVEVRFSEPVAESGLAVGFSLEKDTGSGYEAVATRLLLSADRSVATLRPLDELEDDTVYRVTLSDAIVDDQGRSLTPAPQTRLFRTIDLTPPGPIDPGQIEASFPDAEGKINVAASLGSVNPDDVVILLNETTGASQLASVAPDGSFEGRVTAEKTDQLTLIVRDRLLNETQIPITMLVDRDPSTSALVSVVLGRPGGSFESADGVRVTADAGALRGATQLEASFSSEVFALPADILADPDLVSAFDATFEIHERVEILSSAESFAAPIGIAIDVPAGSSAGERFLLVRSRSVEVGGPLADLDQISGLTLEQNPRQTVERLEVIETMSVKDEDGELILSTDSPPFPGVLEPGLFTILRPRVDTLVFFSGEVRRETETGPVVRGAVVQSGIGDPGARGFAALTDSDGKFVITERLNSGSFSLGDIVSSRLDVNDPSYKRVIRRDILGEAISAPPDETVVELDEPFVLPRRLPSAFIPILGDIEPPEVEFFFSGPTLVGHYTALGSPVTVTVRTTDNDRVDFLQLSLDAGQGFESIPLDADDRATVVPETLGILRFQAEAHDPTGNVTIVDARLVVVAEGGGLPEPSPGGPEDLGSPPSEPPSSEEEEETGAEPSPEPEYEVPVDAEVISPFSRIDRFVSEPLDPATVTVESVKLFDPEGNEVAIEVTLEDGGTRIAIRPIRNLRLNATYRLELTANIADLAGESFVAADILLFIPPPVQRALIELPNTTDVALLGSRVVALNHPDGSSPADRGALHIYEVLDSFTGEFLAEPIEVGSAGTMGRPLSLAIENGTAYVGNRFLGPIATMTPLLTTSTPSDLASRPEAGDILYCDPFTVAIGATSEPLCTAISHMWDKLPNPASNIEVFSLYDPTSPERVTGRATNYVRPDVWNTNTWPDRVEITDQGVAVMSFMQNLELFDPDELTSKGVIGLVQEYASFQGRCDGGLLDEWACLDRPQLPGFPSLDFCLLSTCKETSEFLDVAYVGDVAFALQRNGVRVLSLATPMTDQSDPLRNEPSLHVIPIPGAARVGAVPGFPSWDQYGNVTVRDLLFVPRFSAPLLILDVTNPLAPVVLSDSLPAFGSMSFDACRGVAYLHGGGGYFHAVDFNDPTAPIELNDPDMGKEPFSIEDLGSRGSLNGNVNKDGVAHLALEEAVATVQVELVSSATNLYERATCEPEYAKIRFLDGENHPLDPDADALNVSNYPTNVGLPPSSGFTHTTQDPDNFRLEVFDEGPGTTRTVKIRVLAPDGATRRLIDHTLVRSPYQPLFRSQFLRLVSDDDDDAVGGDQSIKVVLGDTVRATVVDGNGNPVLDPSGAVTTAELSVGRPLEEEDNGASQNRHDIREVKVNIVVLADGQAGGAVASRAEVIEDIERSNERFAQSTIRLQVAGVNMGTGDSGVPPPTDPARPHLPSPLLDGFSSPAFAPCEGPNSDERALITLKDEDPNSIDVFYVDTIDSGTPGAVALGSAYFPFKNLGGDPSAEGFVVIGRFGRTSDPYVLAHELVHVMLNSFHRPSPTQTAQDPVTSLFYRQRAGKRIGPFPDTAVSGAAGHNDTTQLRANAEQLVRSAPANGCAAVAVAVLAGGPVVTQGGLGEPHNSALLDIMDESAMLDVFHVTSRFFPPHPPSGTLGQSGRVEDWLRGLNEANRQVVDVINQEKRTNFQAPEVAAVLIGHSLGGDGAIRVSYGRTCSRILLDAWDPTLRDEESPLPLQFEFDQRGRDPRAMPLDGRVLNLLAEMVGVGTVNLFGVTLEGGLRGRRAAAAGNVTEIELPTTDHFSIVSDVLGLSWNASVKTFGGASASFDSTIFASEIGQCQP